MIGSIASAIGHMFGPDVSVPVFVRKDPPESATVDELTAAIHSLYAQQYDSAELWAKVHPRDQEPRQRIRLNDEAIHAALEDLVARRRNLILRNAPVNRHAHVKAIDERITELARVLESKQSELEKLNPKEERSGQLVAVLEGRGVDRTRVDELTAEIGVLTQSLDSLNAERQVAAREAIEDMLRQYQAGLDREVIRYAKSCLEWIAASDSLNQYLLTVQEEVGIDVANDRERRFPAWCDLTASPYFRMPPGNKHGPAAAEVIDSLKRQRPHLSAKLSAMLDEFHSRKNRPTTDDVEPSAQAAAKRRK